MFGLMMMLVEFFDTDLIDWDEYKEDECSLKRK